MTATVRLRRAWSEHVLVADAAMAAFLLLLGLVSLRVQVRVDDVSGVTNSIPWWVAVTWTVALHVPMAGRRRFPVTSGALVGAVFVGYRLWEVPEYTVSAITIFVSLVAVGHYGGRFRDLVRGMSSSPWPGCWPSDWRSTRYPTSCAPSSASG